MNSGRQTAASVSLSLYRGITGAKKRTLLLFLPMLVVVSCVSLSTGAMDMSAVELFTVLFGKMLPGAVEVKPLHFITIWEIRLPVIVMGILVGAGLGSAGAGMQAILNNPLASPYTLGISSAAGFGAAGAILLGAANVPGWGAFLVAGAAFFFSCLSFFFIFLVVRLKAVSPATMLFAGIALMYLFSALLSLIQYFAPEDVLQQIVFWMFGSLSGAGWDKVIMVTVLVLPSGGVLCANAWKLTALKFGEEVSRGMGIDTGRLRMLTMICASLLTAAAVCFTGVIGFVGLVAPHMARMMLGEDVRFQLPGSCLIGAILLVTADVLGRTLMAPYVLPVGIVTSCIGAPFFIYLTMRKRQ